MQTESRILVVDSDPSRCSETAGRLAESGYLVEQVYAGEEAIRRLSTQSSTRLRGEISATDGIHRDVTLVENQLQQRLEYEAAAVDCLRLLAAHDPDVACLRQVLEELRAAVKASRAYVFRNELDDHHGVCMSQIAEVVAPGISPQIENPLLQHLPYSETSPTLLPRLMSRDPLHGLVAELPEPERSILAAQDVISILTLPIFDDEQLWGFIGFDDCQSARSWAQEDIRLLQVVADMIGVAVQRQQAISALQLQSAALNAAANAIVITNSQGQIEWVNPAWSQLTGYTASECLGETFRLVRSGKQDDAFYRRLWSTIKTGNVWEGEIVNRRKDGTLYLEHETITPVRDADNEIAHYVAIKEDISRRKTLEDALRSSEERVRLAIEAGQLGTFDWDICNDRLYWSNLALTIFGYPNDSPFNARYSDFANRVHPDDLSEVEASIAASMRRGGAYKFECRIVRLDGQVRWIAGSGEFTVENKTPVRLVGTVQDITERKDAELRLQLSEERFKYIAKATNDALWVWDVTTNLLWWSEGLFTLFGFSPDEVESSLDSWTNRIHPDDVNNVLASIHALLESGRDDWQCEYRFRCKEGSYAHVLDRGHAIRDGQGRPIRMVGGMTDMTARIEMAQALQQSEERLRMALEAGQLGTFDWNITTGQIVWNRKHYELFGYSPDEPFDVRFHHFADRLHPEDKSRVDASVNRAMRDRTQLDDECRIVLPDGSIRWMAGRAEFFYDSQGRPERMVGTSQDITERKRAELARQVSESRYRQIVELSPDVVFVNRGGEITFINPMGVKLLRAKSADEIVGRSPLEFIHADSLEAVRDRIVELRRGPCAVPVARQKMVALDGTIIDVESQAASYWNEGELEIQVVCHDITQRIANEQRLRNHARQMELRSVIAAAMSRQDETTAMLQQCTQAMVDYLDLAFARIWTLDGENNSVLRLQASAGLYTHLDGPHSRVRLGELKIGIVAQTQLPHISNAVIDDPQLSDREWACREGLVSFAGYPLLIDDRCLGVMGMFARRKMDGTELETLKSIAEVISQNLDRIAKRRELANLNTQLEQRVEERTARLTESERFNRATLDALSSHVAVLDQDGTIVMVNRAWRHFAETNNADCGLVGTGANYLAVCDCASERGDEDALAVGQALRWVLAGDLQEWSREYPCHSSDERRWFHCRVTRFEIEGIVHVLVSHENVTAMKLSEEALLQAKLEAEHASSAKSEFLAVMSHELRTPLNGILGMNDLLLTTELTARQRQFVEASGASGKLLLQLINDVLDLSKIEAGKLELDPQRCNLESLVYNVADMLLPAARQKDLQLNCQVAASACVVGLCDGDRLRQILINLVGNALKFTPSGSVTISVERVSRENNTALIRFAVVDTGIGVPEDRLDRLFKPFSQVDSSTTRQYGGTGLGLSISHRLVQLMGGTIGATSQVGCGSKFWFEVPVEIVGERRHILQQRQVLEGSRILVVDCVDGERVQLTDCLCEWGCTFDRVATIAEALRAVARAQADGEPYSLVLADCHLTTGDEYNAVQRLVANYGARIVGLGAPQDESTLNYFQSLGILHLLPDPIRPSSLFEAICTELALAERMPADDDADALPVPPVQDELRGHVLVAEDNHINRLYITELLKHLGCTCDTVVNGDQAAAAVFERHYDFVLMDCQMPELDGFAATRQIRQREAEMDDGRHLLIIALTANAMKEDRQRCLDAGMDDYISKPVDAARLRSVMLHHLSDDEDGAVSGARDLALSSSG